jgi:uncharacterized protein YggE
MQTVFTPALITLIVCQMLVSTLLGQMAGGRVGNYEEGGHPTRLFTTSNSHSEPIIVQGSAIRSIKPTELRMIWAITSRHEVPAEANKLLHAQVEKIRQAWIKAGIQSESIVEDFISAIPQYKWTPSEGDNIITEEFESYLIQTNLHLRVADDRQAHQVVVVALENDVTNLIGVDYFANIDQIAEEVRAEALKATQRKSEQLFAIFQNGRQPMPANIAEQTKVIGPDKQYASFDNISAQRIETNWSSNRQYIRIHAARPKNTYYKGSPEFADTNQFGLPMNPEILVKSTVEIAYVNPWQQEIAKEEMKKKE